MSIVKETSSGEHYLEKVKTEGDEPYVSGLQLYQRNVGSDGASGNTVFTLTQPYSPGSNTLFVYLNGQKATLEVGPSLPNEYEETDPVTVTFGASLLAADIVEFIVVGTYVLDAEEAEELLGIVSGTKMYFYQAAAPTGWTIDTTLGDAVLAVHGSSSYYGSGSGGEQRGTWTQPDHTLTEAEMPSHVHPGPGGALFLISPSGTHTGGGDNATQAANTGSTGGDQPHNHGTAWRPFANVGIIATRD